MARPSGIISLILLLGLAACDASGGRTETAPGICTISLTRVLRIPISTLDAHTATESPDASPTTLLLSPGATDEPPEGPDGFDVLEDGSLLITDPLRSRLSSFDSQGKFRRTWKIGFRADSVTVIADGLVLVREASTGRLHTYDQEGQPRPVTGDTLPERGEARLQPGQNRGTVSRPSIDRTHGGPLGIQFDKPGLTLLSLQSLTTDQKGDTYVAVEATAGGRASEAINLNKYVRRYSSDGKLLCEIADISLDYYVPP